MAKEKINTNEERPLQEMLELGPRQFVPGCVVEITTKTADRIVVRRYYVENDNWLDEEILEFPATHKRNKKNLLDFLRGAKDRIKEDYGDKEPVYIDSRAKKYLEKVI